jgi:hypothetical protein
LHHAANGAARAVFAFAAGRPVRECAATQPAGQRPSLEAVASRQAEIHLRLLGNRQGVIDLDAEAPNRAFELGVPEQELSWSQVPVRR